MKNSLAGARRCPQCGRPIKEAERLCGYCWMTAFPAQGDGDGAKPPQSGLRAGGPWWKFWA